MIKAETTSTQIIPAQSVTVELTTIELTLQTIVTQLVDEDGNDAGDITQDNWNDLFAGLQRLRAEMVAKEKESESKVMKQLTDEQG